MHAILLGAMWGMIGLDSGSKALPGGGIEYIIQIADQEIDIFKRQKHIEVDIPSKLQEIHTIHVVIGNDVLPQESPLKPASATAKPASASAGSNLRSPLATQSKSPFAALTSLWDRYPLPQNASDPTPDRPAERDVFGSKRAGSNREPLDRKPNDDPPFSGESSKSRPDSLSQAAERVGEDNRQRRAESSSKESTSRESLHEPPKSTGSFTAVVLVLLGSLGGNVYMGWITWETRGRYHALVRRRKKGERHSREDADDAGREAEEE